MTKAEFEHEQPFYFSKLRLSWVLKLEQLIYNFEYHTQLKDVFSNTDWVIPFSSPAVRGGNKRKTSKYYCPKGKISYYTTQKNVGVHFEDV